MSRRAAARGGGRRTPGLPRRLSRLAGQTSLIGEQLFILRSPGIHCPREKTPLLRYILLIINGLLFFVKLPQSDTISGETGSGTQAPVKHSA